MNSILSLDGVEKRYGSKTAVTDLTLSLPGGEIFGFLGPNGAGKTTTFKMIVGLLRPSAGSIRVGNLDVVEHPVETKRMIGFVPDTPLLYEKLTAIEFLRFVADLHGIPRPEADRKAAELLQMFDLLHASGDLIESLSHGMRQKTALAGALIHDPRLLILDEPTVGLDPKSARLIKDILRRLTRDGVAVILSTHILEIAEQMCDRIGILHHGRLISVGTLNELRSGLQDRSLEDIFLQLTAESADARIAGLDGKD